MCDHDDETEASTSFHREIISTRIMTKSSRQREESGGSTTDDETTTATIDPAMKAEIEAAVAFLTDFLVKAPKQEFSQESVDLFRRSLQSQLCRQYSGHWHSANPLKGSGFRCLRINGKLDPLVARAAEASRLPLRKVRQAFPAELTVWVDPGDVSVRFGEEGSIGVWFASRRSGDEEKNRPSAEDHQQQHQVYLQQQMYQRSTPPLSSTPPGVQAFYHHHRVPYHQASPLHYQQRQQSSPVWNPQWQQQQQAVAFSPQQNRSSPSSSQFVAAATSGNNGFAMALNHQQQQMQLRQTPLRYQQQHASSRVSPQPQAIAVSESATESGEEQRCKMLAERLMRENLNLMASLAPGLVSTRAQPVGVGVN